MIKLGTSTLLVAMLSLLVALIAAPSIAGDTAPNTAAMQDVKQRLVQARKRLDQAAQELARLHVAAQQSSDKAGGRAMLGVLIDEPARKQGVYISGVTPGGGAADAGLRAGDVILAINDTALDGGSDHPHSQISKVMMQVNAGDTVAVRYARGSAQLVVDVVTQAAGHHAQLLAHQNIDLDKYEQIEIDVERFDIDDMVGELSRALGVDLQRKPPAQAHFAANLEAPHLVSLEPDLARYFGTDSGVLLVAAGASEKKLKGGDVIKEVAGQVVRQPSDVRLALQAHDAASQAKQSSYVPIKIMRQQQVLLLEVAPESLSLMVKQVIKISSDDANVRIELTRTPTGRTNLAP